MARRGENIHKRKDGRWEGRYIKGRSETGKAIWGYVYAYSYVDAKSALIRKKVKAADYTVPLGAQELTISVLSELWLSTLNDLEDSSIAHYRYSIEHYILPVIGNLRISQLSRAKLELCVLQIISPVGGEHKPFGTSLSRECISLVRRLCKYAYTLHLMPMIEALPAASHRLPKTAMTLRCMMRKATRFICIIRISFPFCRRKILQRNLCWMEMPMQIVLAWGS